VSQFFSVHPTHPQSRLLHRAAEILASGGLVVFPTDTAYALGCHIGDKQALERIRRLRRLDKHHHLTLMCRDLSEISLYARVDDANYRRGFFSINALWKNKVAVLVGDYLLSRGLLLSVDNQDFDLLKIVSQAVREMSEGELLQIEKARRLDITEDIYYEVIRQKTASLIGSCCAVGASSSGADEETIERFRCFGEKVGMAFQIKDDLFDYGTAEIGKPVGIDIKEKKMTLPLIYALQHTDWLTKRKMIYLVKNNDGKNDRVAQVIDFVKKSGGLDYAIQRMNQFYREALEILQTFEPSPSRTSLEQLLAYTIEREK